MQRNPLEDRAYLSRMEASVVAACQRGVYWCGECRRAIAAKDEESIGEAIAWLNKDVDAVRVGLLVGRGYGSAALGKLCSDAVLACQKKGDQIDRDSLLLGIAHGLTRLSTHIPDVLHGASDLPAALAAPINLICATLGKPLTDTQSSLAPQTNIDLVRERLLPADASAVDEELQAYASAAMGDLHKYLSLEAAPRLAASAALETASFMNDAGPANALVLLSYLLESEGDSTTLSIPVLTLVERVKGYLRSVEEGRQPSQLDALFKALLIQLGWGSPATERNNLILASAIGESELQELRTKQSQVNSEKNVAVRRAAIAEVVDDLSGVVSLLSGPEARVDGEDREKVEIAARALVALGEQEAGAGLLDAAAEDAGLEAFLSAIIQAQGKVSGDAPNDALQALYPDHQHPAALRAVLSETLTMVARAKHDLTFAIEGEGTPELIAVAKEAYALGANAALATGAEREARLLHSLYCMLDDSLFVEELFEDSANYCLLCFAHAGLQLFLESIEDGFFPDVGFLESAEAELERAGRLSESAAPITWASEDDSEATQESMFRALLAEESKTLFALSQKFDQASSTCIQDSMAPLKRLVAGAKGTGNEAYLKPLNALVYRLECQVADIKADKAVVAEHDKLFQLVLSDVVHWFEEEGSGELREDIAAAFGALADKGQPEQPPIKKGLFEEGSIEHKIALSFVEKDAPKAAAVVQGFLADREVSIDDLRSAMHKLRAGPRAGYESTDIAVRGWEDYFAHLLNVDQEFAGDAAIGFRGFWDDYLVGLQNFPLHDQMPRAAEHGAFVRGLLEAIVEDAPAEEIPAEQPAIDPEPQDSLIQEESEDLDDAHPSDDEDLLDEEIAAEFMAEAPAKLEEFRDQLGQLELAPEDKGLAQALKRTLHQFKGCGMKPGLEVVVKLSGHVETLFEQMSLRVAKYKDWDDYLQEVLSVYERIVEAVSQQQMLTFAEDSVAAIGQAVGNRKANIEALREAHRPLSSEPVEEVISVSDQPGAAAEEEQADELQRSGTTSKSLRKITGYLNKLNNEQSQRRRRRAISAPLQVDTALYDEAVQDAVAGDLLEHQSTLALDDLLEAAENLDMLIEASRRSLTEAMVVADSHSALDLNALTKDQRLKLQGESQAVIHEMIGLTDDRLAQVSAAMRELLEGAADARRLGRQRKLVGGSLTENLVSSRQHHFSSIADRYRRLASTLSQDLGKEVEVDFQDNGLVMDKVMLDGLREPLEHLVRNALDHGLEGPDEREASGKPAVGKLTFAANNVGRSVVISVSDDGRGIDADKVRDKAIRLGLISEDQELERDQLLRLITSSGFSTSDSVSDISGRGVGMDVVRQAVETVGGVLGISSESGKGTQFSITLPMYSGATPSFVFRIGGALFAIPQKCIEQLVNLDSPSQSVKNPETGHDLQSIHLTRFLGLPDEVSEGNGSCVAFSLRGNALNLAIVAERLESSKDLYVLQHTGVLATIPGVTGYAELDSGEIAQVVDPVEWGKYHLQGAVGRLTTNPALSKRTRFDDPATVMIVDDQHSCLLMAETVVKDYGWAPVTLETAEEALSLVEQNTIRPDLFLLDIDMGPGRLNGDELALKLRALKQASRTPIIFVTSKESEEVAHAMEQAQVQGYIHKPISEQAFAESWGSIITKVA